MRTNQRVLHALLLSTLGALCVGLGYLQYQWTGELAAAERERVGRNLQAAAEALAGEFNATIATAGSALQPDAAAATAMGVERAYTARFQEWRKVSGRADLFGRLAIAVPAPGGLRLLLYDPAAATFRPSTWPPEWIDIREALLARLEPHGPPPSVPSDPYLLVIPRFRPAGAPADSRPREEEWLVLALNPAYVHDTLLPELLQRHVEPTVPVGVDAEVHVRGNPSHILFRSGTIRRPAAASVPLLAVSAGVPARGESSVAALRPSWRARWELLVSPHGDSLTAAVQRTRWRNLAISLGVLLLLAATIVVLIRLFRRTRQLSDLQLNFVAGISHEFRTPLTVIRTAAFNLRTKASRSPEKVERYGELIEAEAERLTALVEQVLRFAGARGGQVIRDKLPVRLEAVLEESIRYSKPMVNAAGAEIESLVEPGLPMVEADVLALTHAIGNLLENAAKYGVGDGKWIGVFASGLPSGAVRITVADRGPGIPAEEQRHIFDAFFRGRRALQDQIHGTGLGLHLVKQIVQAHGGTVRVMSRPEGGAEFTIELPALQEHPA